jgi:hypothetical protein
LIMQIQAVQLTHVQFNLHYARPLEGLVRDATWEVKPTYLGIGRALSCLHNDHRPMILVQSGVEYNNC